MVNLKNTLRDEIAGVLWLDRFIQGFVAALVIAALVFLLSGRARAADPDRDRKVRVALALAEPTKVDRDRAARVAMALSDHATEPISAPAVAPPPRAKDKASCVCGDNCACCGTCPACPAAVAPKSTPAAPRVIGYRQECWNGRCVWVPVYEP